jgi:hypothetical protein
VVLHPPVESNVAKKVRLENIISIENRSVKLAEGRLWKLLSELGQTNESQIGDVDVFPTKEVQKK